MSIANYNDLLAAVAGHLHTDSLTAVIPDLVTLGEARINRRLRLAQQETTTTLTCSIAARTISLPSDFFEMTSLALVYDSTGYQFISVAPPDMVDLFDDSTARKSTPTYFLIRENLEFDCIPDTAYSVKMRYVKKWNIASTVTNWLLTNYPDIYLYISLAAAEAYRVNDKRITLWNSLATTAMNEAKAQNVQFKNRPSLRVDGFEGHRTNILMG